MKWHTDMTVYNKEIAGLFYQLADLLEISNDNPFRIRAYRNAARVIESLPQEVARLVKAKADLAELPGIGKDLAEKIRTIVETGHLPLLIQMEKEVPAVLTTLLKIEGLGPRRVQQLYEKLGIRSLKDLEQSIASGRLRELKGFGDRLVGKIRLGIQHAREYSKRIRLNEAFPIVEGLLTYLKKSKNVLKAECAGSFRRRKETVGDLDFLVASDHPRKAIDHFVAFDEIASVLSKGETRSTVRLRSGTQVDLRAVPENSYGAALVYFTGSKAHNISIRRLAQRKNLKINEYSVSKGKKAIAGKTEKEVYRTLGMSYVEPEMREDRGEIELALRHRLPGLITLADIRGDLHSHTSASDGNADIESMARKAKSLGYSYLAITDHSRHLRVAHGLDAKRLLAQIRKIDKINERLEGIVILKSVEVDILEDGKLDMPDKVLKLLDFTVCSVHYKFDLDRKRQTERIIRAMDNPYFTILAHPSGRLINQREPYQVEMEALMKAARERNCILELNAQPERMDLDDALCKTAREMGVRIAISTDAHDPSQMDYMQYGVYQARRGWLQPKDVVNTATLRELKKLLKRR